MCGGLALAGSFRPRAQPPGRYTRCPVVEKTALSLGDRISFDLARVAATSVAAGARWNARLWEAQRARPEKC